MAGDVMRCEDADPFIEAAAVGETTDAVDTAVAEGETQAVDAERELEAPSDAGELELEAPAESPELPESPEAGPPVEAPAVETPEAQAAEEIVPSEDALLEDLMDGSAVTPAEATEGMAAQDAVGNGEAHADGGLDSLIGTDETSELELDSGDALSRLAEEFAAENKSDDANGHHPHAPGRSSDNGAH